MPVAGARADLLERGDKAVTEDSEADDLLAHGPEGSMSAPRGGLTLYSLRPGV